MKGGKANISSNNAIVGTHFFPSTSCNKFLPSANEGIQNYLQLAEALTFDNVYNFGAVIGKLVSIIISNCRTLMLLSSKGDLIVAESNST